MKQGEVTKTYLYHIIFKTKKFVQSRMRQDKSNEIKKYFISLTKQNDSQLAK